VADLPVVLVFAPWPVRLQSPPASEFEAREFDCRWHSSDERLNDILVRERPDAIASFGDRAAFPRLASAPYDVRRRWLHFDVEAGGPSETDRERAGTLVYSSILHRVLTAPHVPPGSKLLVSVFTPTFRSGDRIRRAFRSLQAQTYDRWEWVVADDSDDEGATWRTLSELAAADARVSIHASGRHSGRIGEMKRRACALSRGDILVELDHDDELTPDALADIADTFRRDPRVGFVYSDWAEIEEGRRTPLTYPDGWAFGYGRYRTERYRGQDLQVASAPPINGTTIRHIVSAPNHVRAWRRDEYWRIGGHNPHLHVADDYELIVRTFLQTEMRHLPTLHYLQYLRSGTNAQDRRRQEIQRLVRAITHHYDEPITERLRELGLPDRDRRDSRPAAAPPSTLIVSFTTLPSRIHRIGPMVDSLRNQTAKPDEIRLYVPRFCTRERTGYDIPAWLAAAGVTLIRCDDDWGPATKLIPCLVDGGHPDDTIVTVDDDVVYEPHLLEDLVAASRARPDAVLCMMGVDQRGAFVHAEHLTSPTEVAMVGGYRGVLYKRRFFHVDALRREHAATKTGEIHLADDHLLSRHVRRGGTRLFVASPGRAFRFLHLPNGISAPENVSAATKAAAAVSAYYDQACQDLSVIVLDATGGPRAVACLESVRRFCPGAEIVLVGNGVVSNARHLADTYIPLDGNIGVAAGWNLAARRATRSCLAFLNDDAAFVDEETPPRLLAAARAGAVAGPYSDRAKPPQGDVARADTPVDDRHVDAVVGVCLLVGRDLFDRVGGFDARLLTWEDDDFCLRARTHGAPSLVVGGAWVAHERHASFRALGLDVQAIMQTNRRRFEQMHAPVRVAAIARDEENAVQAYFEQFRQVTREGILLDTGSTDRTTEMAEAAGVRIARHEDVEASGFAAARNAAVALACGDRPETWIVMFDPDERLDAGTVAAIPELITSAGDRFDVFLAPLEAVAADGSRRFFTPKPFLFRAGACRWRYLVHEKLVGGRHALVANARIEHQLVLHDPERRRQAAALYNRLAAREPYFTDAAFRTAERQAWPILDHERLEDARIETIHAGPLVSVVIPTYDRPDLCARAVASALSQDWAALEVIVVGDACPRFDAVRQAVGDPPRVRYLNLPANHGAGGAVPRNLGVLAATGDWIAYLDDDNVWDTDHVSSLMAAIQRTQASWGFSSMQVDGTDLEFATPARGRIDTSCLIHATRLFHAIGPWRSIQELNDYAHDWEFVSRLLATSDTWAATRRPTVRYNVNTSGQSGFIRQLVTTVASRSWPAGATPGPPAPPPRVDS
jgi:GT2 family glycosyltransferase